MLEKCALFLPMLWVVVHAADCSIGGASLCSCSELIKRRLIHAFEVCTQGAAVSFCESGQCVESFRNSSYDQIRSVPGTQHLESLPYSFHHDVGPFDMTWGFPSPDTIEIEFSLPSDYYIGLGLTADGVGDAIAGWVDETGKVHVRDYWDAGNREPLTDESKGCKNDIEPVAGSNSNGVTTVRFRRKLQTGDKEDCDEQIFRGPMDINYAWCDERWCFDYRNGCKGYEDGCLDSPHSGDAANHVSVDFSGKMLSSDIVV